MKKMLLMIAILVLGLTQAQERTVHLLHLGGITGGAADVGVPYAAGIEDFCRWAVEQRILPRHRLVCTVRDDQWSAPITARLFEEALDRAKPAIFLSFGTGSNLALKALIQEVRIPTIPAAAHIGLIDPPHNQFMFLPVSSYSEQVVALMEYIDRIERNARIALVVHPSPFGRAPVEHARQAATILGQTIVDVREVGAGNLDNTVLLRSLEAAGARWIIHQNVAGPVANILRDNVRLGLQGRMRHLGAVYTGGSDLIALAGDAVEGFLWASSYFTLDEDQPGIRLQRELARRFGRPARILESTNYTAGMMAAAIAIEAMRRADLRFNGRIDHETVYQSIIDMNGPNHFRSGFAVTTKAGIEVDFSRTDQASAEGLRVLEARGGRFVPITEPFTSALFRRVWRPSP